MKRFICALLILCLIPSFAFGMPTVEQMIASLNGSVPIDLESFNDYAAVFGVSEISMDSGVDEEGCWMFEADGVALGFFHEAENVTSVVVEGDGIPFLMYCMAAILSGNAEYLERDAGYFFSMYLLTRANGEEHYNKTTLMRTMYLAPSEKGYRFIILR